MGKVKHYTCHCGRDQAPSFLNRASGKSHLSSGFFLRSLHPQDLLVCCCIDRALFYLWLPNFLLDHKRQLPLNSCCRITSMLFPRLIFQKIFACPMESVRWSALLQVTFQWRLIIEKEWTWSVWPQLHEIYNKNGHNLMFNAALIGILLRHYRGWTELVMQKW